MRRSYRPPSPSRNPLRSVSHVCLSSATFSFQTSSAHCDKETADRFPQRRRIKGQHCYFVSAPTFQTKPAKYAWLNDVRAVVKMVEVKPGKGGHLICDLFALSFMAHRLDQPNERSMLPFLELSVDCCLLASTRRNTDGAAIVRALWTYFVIQKKMAK
jgi:hypothetical protein